MDTPLPDYGKVRVYHCVCGQTPVRPIRDDPKPCEHCRHSLSHVPYTVSDITLFTRDLLKRPSQQIETPDTGHVIKITMGTHGKIRVYKCVCGGTVVRPLHGDPRPCDCCDRDLSSTPYTVDDSRLFCRDLINRATLHKSASKTILAQWREGSLTKTGLAVETLTLPINEMSKVIHDMNDKERRILGLFCRNFRDDVDSDIPKVFNGPTPTSAAIIYALKVLQDI